MRKFVGPPKRAANEFVKDRLLASCIECECCGEISHHKGNRTNGRPVQVQIMGFVITARRAMYMAAFPDKVIQKNRRISSRCRNPNCINPKLLLQATPAQIIQAGYANGSRDRAAAIAHLAGYSRVNNFKLADEAVMKILEDDRTGKFAAHEYGITPEYFNAIKRGVSRRVGNPFAGLLRAQERRAA